MLRGIPANLPPELFKTLLEMGHGDEICIADANFPGYANAARIINCAGSTIPHLLDSIMKFLPLDRFVDETVFLMQVMEGHAVVPVIWKEYERILRKYDVEGGFKGFSFIDRLSFYEKAKNSYAVIVTGETSLYANLILKKGIVEPE